MGTKYPGNSISGYDSSPPSDDGTVVETNKVKYATTKTKLADPVKTLAEAMETDLVAHFDRGPVAATSNATLGAANYNEIIEATGTHTQTLSDAATLGAGWFCDIVNAGTGIITLGRDTAGDTIDGATANATIPSLKSLRVFVNAAETGFITHNTNPLTTRGDMMYVDSSGDVNRLPVGGASEVLKSDGTDMSWGAPTVLSTRGDLLSRDASVDTRIPVGGADTVLTSDGTDPAWGTVNQSMVAGAAVGQAELKTATVSLAGVIGSGISYTYITLNAYAFWPMIHAVDGDSLPVKLAGHNADGASADNPRFSFIGGGAKTDGSYDVDYRYIQA